MLTTRRFLTASALIAALGLSACAGLQPSSSASLGARLSGANEVPANTSSGSGSVQATLDKQTRVLSWTVSYAGLTGPVKAGHFHGPAAAGSNAGVALGFSGALDSPIKGTATLTESQMADVLAGKWYVNLHTAANPGGEVRGQLTAP